MKQKLRFELTIETNDNGVKKFLQAVQNRNALTQEVSRHFASILCIFCGWDTSDEVVISNFVIGKKTNETQEIDKQKS